MKNVDIYPEFARQVEALGDGIALGSFKLWAVLLMLTGTIAIFKPAFVGTKAMPEFNIIVRGIFVGLLLAFYPQVMDFLGTLMEVVCNLVPPSDFFTELYDSSKFLPSEASLEGKGSFETAFYYITNLMSGIKGLFVQAMTGGMLKFLRFFYEIFRAMIIAILYVTGPFALLSSMIPGAMQKAGDKWMVSFINIHLWLLTLNILDRLFLDIWPDWSATLDHYDSYSTETMLTHSAPAKEMMYFLINIVMVICYFLVPFITALYIPKGSASGLMSKVVSTGAAIGYAAVSIATTAVGGVGGLAGAGGMASAGGAGAAGKAGGMGASGMGGAGGAGSAGASGSSGGSGSAGATGQRGQAGKSATPNYSASRPNINSDTNEE